MDYSRQKAGFFIRFFFAVTCSSCLLLVGCQQSESSKSDVLVEVRKLGKLGSVDSLDSGFGNIVATAASYSGSLYVLDRSLLQIKEYSNDDELKNVIQLTTGQGPGEVLAPIDLAVDTGGNIFLADRARRSIMRFSEEGKYESSFSLDFMPTQLDVNEDGLYVTSFWPTSSSVLHLYSLDGTLLRSFMKRPEEWRRIAKTGNFGRITLFSSNGGIYSYPSPYKIFRFDSTGSLVDSVSGPIEFKEPPEAEPDEVVEMTQGSRGLALLSNDYIINVVKNEENWHLDVFSRDLLHIKRLDASLFEMSENGLEKVSADSSGHVYFEYSNPGGFPYVAKYLVQLDRVDNQP